MSAASRPCVSASTERQGVRQGGPHGTHDRDLAGQSCSDRSCASTQSKEGEGSRADDGEHRAEARGVAADGGALARDDAHGDHEADTDRRRRYVCSDGRTRTWADAKELAAARPDRVGQRAIAPIVYRDRVGEWLRQWQQQQQHETLRRQHAWSQRSGSHINTNTPTAHEERQAHRESGDHQDATATAVHCEYEDDDAADDHRGSVYSL